MGSGINTGAESPSYLERFELTRAPFAPAVDDAFFCADSSLAQRLDMLQHLTVFGKQVLLITGPTGIGKTALLNQYLHRAGPNWRVCRMTGDTLLTRDAFDQQLRDCFMPESAGEPGVALETALAALHQAGQLALLVIDDAQELSSKVLERLIALAALNDDGALLLHIVLCGDAELETRLAKLGATAPEQLHVIQLAPLSELQTGAYLQHRLEVAGLAGDSPFTSAAVKNIYKASGGVPAEINARAHTMLLDIHSRTRSTARVADGADRGGIGWRVPAAAVVGVLAILAAVFLGPGEEGDDTQATAEGPQATVPLALPDPAPATSPAAAAGTQDVAVNGDAPGDAAGGTPVDAAGEVAAPAPLPEPPPLPPPPPEPPQPVLTQPVTPGVSPPSARGEIQLSAQPPTAEFVPPVALTPTTPAPARSVVEAPVGKPAVPATVPPAAPAADAPAPPPGVIEAEPVPVDAAPPAAEPAKPTPPLAASVDAVPAQPAPKPAAAKPAEQPAAVKPTSPEPPATKSPEPKQTAVEKPPAPVAKPAAAPVEKPAPVASKSANGGGAGSGQGIAWLKAQPAGHYTLQLVGSRSEAAVKRFMRSHGLGSQAAYYRTTHQGGDWFVLVYGSYADRNAAQRGVASLPAAVRSGKPWPRSFASVQADLGKSR